VLGPAARLADDREDVAERLLELGDEAAFDDPLALVPADHPGREDELAPCGDGESVAVAARARP
jgi:hypothetical protein